MSFFNAKLQLVRIFKNNVISDRMSVEGTDALTQDVPRAFLLVVVELNN
jgi:hypothetical protein